MLGVMPRLAHGDGAGFRGREPATQNSNLSPNWKYRGV